MTRDIQRAARRGAAFLDEKEPGWAALIDLTTLDLDYVDSCVLGQLYGHYDVGLIVLGLRVQSRLPDSGWERLWDQRYTLGFCGVDESDVLTAAWKAEIARRTQP